jgi:WhiB family transcriptional regulator, redox-sensing transcriptional regulator
VREHGTHACYVWGPEPGCLPGRGCRCTACSLARSEYERKRKQQAEPSYVAAGPVREHLAFLSSEGVGWKQAARSAGLSPSVVWKILYGPPERGPAKRCRPETAAKLLAVTPADGAAGALVDAGPTWDHIGTLLARGWTKRAIAKAIGQTGGGLQVKRTRVQRGTAEAIKALLDQPVPADVGKAWSAHHQANAEPEVETERQVDDIDRLMLDLAEVLEARIDENGWRKRAACLGKPTWMFFPGRGDSKTTDAAKAVCATCPVAAECLAAHADEPVGIFGGTSYKQRRRREVAA